MRSMVEGACGQEVILAVDATSRPLPPPPPFGRSPRSPLPTLPRLRGRVGRGAGEESDYQFAFVGAATLVGT